MCASANSCIRGRTTRADVLFTVAVYRSTDSKTIGNILCAAIVNTSSRGCTSIADILCTTADGSTISLTTVHILQAGRDSSIVSTTVMVNSLHTTTNSRTVSSAAINALSTATDSRS